MRIALIVPPRSYLVEPFAHPPLGVLYIAATVRAAGHDVLYCDMAADRTIPDADLYGVTASCGDADDLPAIVEELRSRRGLSVLGGSWVTATRELHGFDAAILGEGEKAILDLLADYPDIKQFYQAERITDLDTIPWPARDLLAVKGHDKWLGGVNATTSLITSRGCPFNCAFCGSETIWSRRVHFRLAEGVLAEVEGVKERYGIKAFRIHDDQFVLNRKRLDVLLEGFARLDIMWRASVRVDSVSPDLLKDMARAGCQELAFGVESGDQDVLNIIQKGATTEQAEAALRWTHEAGIRARVLLMVGLPGETRATPRRTIEFLERTKAYWSLASVTEYTPLPGTPIHDEPHMFGVRVRRGAIPRTWYLYSPSGLTPFINPVEVEGMTEQELVENKQVVRDYVLATGRQNRG